MKAVRVFEFGGPEVLKLVEIERPLPAADEILVKVFATSVNPADYIVRQGGNELLRPLLKLPLGLGLDVAGIVVEVGTNVTNFEKCDEVYGCPNFPGDGSYAEYITAKATQFALKPKSVSFNEAGAIPSCALIAWNIVELGKIQTGQRVLIHGAAGGVGNLALQIAKAKGAHVIGTASANNLDFLKQIGADETIDYRTQKFEEILSDIDLVFNASPVRDNEARLKSAKVLKEGGIFICTQLDNPFAEDFLTAMVNKGAKAMHVNFTHTFSSLNEIATLIDEEKIKVIISKIYPLKQVAEAHKESETKHVRGKLVLEVRKEN